MTTENIPVPAKAWYVSTTIWLNIAAFVAMVLALPEVSGIIPPVAVPIIAAITAVANLLVRVYRTSGPIVH